MARETSPILSINFWGDYGDPYALLTKEYVGGKAFGLYQMCLLAGGRVPEAYVIPCKFCFERPSLETLKKTHYWKHLFRWVVIENGVKFAVRSGAPTSMPGLMETKLNVACDEEAVYQAIVEVWDSWASPQCEQYRKDNNVPNTGTAVVIQHMVDAAFSGVLFTADPSKSLVENLMNPTMLCEWVDGLGDGLVGGTVTPFSAVIKPGQIEKSLENVDEKYRLRLRTLVSMVSPWDGGPWDIEFCVDKAQNLRLLQRRPLKLPPPKEGNHQLPPNSKYITVGAPIGVEKLSSGKLLHWAQVGEKDSGYIVYLDAFEPAAYKTMSRSVGIICSVGGKTCHAAIVGRGLGLPVITAVSPMPTIEADKHCLLNGETGGIYEVDAKDAPHDQAPAPAAALRTKRGIRTPTWWKLWKDGTAVIPRFEPMLLAVRFYHAMAHERYERIPELAEFLAFYTYLSVCGELRHLMGKTDYSEKRTSLIDALAAVGIDSIRANIAQRKYREQFVDENILTTFVNGAVSPSRAVRTMQIARACFTDVHWTARSYGGKKWGVIAEHLLEYLLGNYNDMMFLDGLFNLQHNSGSLFGKFVWLTQHDCANFDKFLDTRRVSMDPMQALELVEKTARPRGLRYILTPTLHEIAASDGKKYLPRFTPKVITSEEIHFTLQVYTTLAKFHQQMRDGYKKWLGKAEPDKVLEMPSKIPEIPASDEPASLSFGDALMEPLPLNKKKKKFTEMKATILNEVSQSHPLAAVFSKAPEGADRQHAS